MLLPRATVDDRSRLRQEWVERNPPPDLKSWSRSLAVTPTSRRRARKEKAISEDLFASVNMIFEFEDAQRAQAFVVVVENRFGLATVVCDQRRCMCWAMILRTSRLPDRSKNWHAGLMRLR